MKRAGSLLLILSLLLVVVGVAMIVVQQFTKTMDDNARIVLDGLGLVCTGVGGGVLGRSSGPSQGQLNPPYRRTLDLYDEIDRWKLLLADQRGKIEARARKDLVQLTDVVHVLDLLSRSIDVQLRTRPRAEDEWRDVLKYRGIQPLEEELIRRKVLDASRHLSTYDPVIIAGITGLSFPQVRRGISSLQETGDLPSELTPASPADASVPGRGNK